MDCERALRASGGQYREFLKDSVSKLGFNLHGYPYQWAVYHIRPLASFSSPDAEEANRMTNLEVRPAHNREVSESLQRELWESESWT